LRTKLKFIMRQKTGISIFVHIISL
jgi:hypothetical protein